MAATTAKAMIFSMSTLDHSLDPRSNWVPVSKYFNSAFASGIERRQESRHALAPIGQKAQPAAAVRSRKTERSRGAGSGPRQFRLKARTPSSSRCYKAMPKRRTGDGIAADGYAENEVFISRLTKSRRGLI